MSNILFLPGPEIVAAHNSHRLGILDRRGGDILFTHRSIEIIPRISSTFFSTNSTDLKLTHVDGQGKASMVDVGGKVDSDRLATATGRIYVGEEILAMIKNNTIKKGDVLATARISGIMNAKKTSEIIPLCHNISLNSIKVEAELDEDRKEVKITATVKCGGKTGVEMEALVAVTSALLTIYDMCKAVSQQMVIRDVHLVKKSGGKTDYQRQSEE